MYYTYLIPAVYCKLLSNLFHFVAQRLQQVAKLRDFVKMLQDNTRRYVHEIKLFVYGISFAEFHSLH